ncbi:unnamed protein product [Prunus armeniaca]|uniref:Uncharacterized protein n=1 Tax=Prunus armeniaca TaxID=36596 RepID=A0A6J5W9Z5_PRUAR|nr:unnamed protein product [Prunus armeniaca]CAB4298426.1 unnamed protein product [Prunus armeniaca]
MEADAESVLRVITPPLIPIIDTRVRLFVMIPIIKCVNIKQRSVRPASGKVQISWELGHK